HEGKAVGLEHLLEHVAAGARDVGLARSALEAGGGALRRVVDRQALHLYIEVAAPLVGIDEATDVPGRHHVVVTEFRQPAASVDPNDDQRIPRLGPVNLCAALHPVAIVASVHICPPAPPPLPS